MMNEQLCAVLWDCVDELPGKQPQAIRLRYQQCMTVEAVGCELRGTRAEAQKWINRGLRELRAKKRLRPFAPEDERIYSMSLVGNGVERFNRTWTSSTERAALMRLEP